MNAADGSTHAPRGLSPELRIHGVVRPPGSKSLAIRALLAASLAEGRGEVRGVPESEDVVACLGVLEACGLVAGRPAPDVVVVQGRPPSPEAGWGAPQPLVCGESGTLARLVTAVAGLCGAPGVAQRIEVQGTLLTRDSGPLFDALASVGVRIARDAGKRDGWPLTLTPTAPPETVMLNTPVSSQELSGLLLALAAHPAGPRGRSALVLGGLPSEPYARMTASVLEAFGARFGAAGSEWRVAGPLVAPQAGFEVEPDASAAAVALAAGCLSGGTVRVEGFQERSTQGDVAIVEHLAAFGCEAAREGDALVARGFPSRAAELDLEDTPDLAPVLAAVAGAYALRAGGAARATTLTGLETLNGKESRRVEVLADGLRALGVEVDSTDDELVIGPVNTPGTAPLVLDPHGDHRMAFAFALLGLVRPALRVEDPGCVAKSWPSFWDDLAAAATKR